MTLLTPVFHFLSSFKLVLWDIQPSTRSLFHSIEEKIYDSSTISLLIRKNKKNNSISQDGEKRSSSNSTTTTPNTTRPSYFSNISENLFDDSINFLENPPIIKQYSKKEFKVGVYLSQLVVAMCSQKYDLLAKIFLSQKVKF